MRPFCPLPQKPGRLVHLWHTKHNPESQQVLKPWQLLLKLLPSLETHHPACSTSSLPAGVHRSSLAILSEPEIETVEDHGSRAKMASPRSKGGWGGRKLAAVLLPS